MQCVPCPCVSCTVWFGTNDDVTFGAGEEVGVVEIEARVQNRDLNSLPCERGKLYAGGLQPPRELVFVEGCGLKTDRFSADSGAQERIRQMHRERRDIRANSLRRQETSRYRLGGC